MTTANPQRPTLANDLGATAALTAYSLAIVTGFARVFAGWEFFPELAWLAVIGHGAGLILRRVGVPGWAAVPLTLIALTWAAALMFYGETTTWLVPTADTWAQFTSELQLVRDQFRVAVAPVIFGAGWDALAAVGVILAVVLADVFAFRAYARAEALVPGGVLFVFVAALGDDRLRIPSTVLVVGTGVLATIVLRAYHAPTRGPLQRTIPIAVTGALVIALAAGVVGPRLPGAQADALYDTRSGGGGVANVVSPLVDIRSRLTNQQNNEMFVVTSELESYWRSTALPQFDGTRWSIPRRPLESTGDRLDVGRPGSVEMRHTVRITDLEGTLVPAAPDPIRATGPKELRFNPETATFVTLDGELARGDTFQFISASPRFEPAALDAATSTAPPDPIYLEIPGDLPAVVEETARTVTADATTSYQAALALQNWFQSEFEYSLEIQPGHGNNAIESFLRERKGYCEQFAGTYSAMLRSIGIPARVAVGFTSGNQRSDGSYSVLGKNAHAWPEVWFDQYGWVPFEPTPGRGAPDGENHTGIAPAQDTSGVDPDAPLAEPDEGVPPTTTPSTLLPEDFTDSDPLLNLPDFEQGDAAAVPPPGDDGGGGLPWLPVLTGLALAAIVLPPLVRRVRRRALAGDALDQLGRMWQQSLDAVGEVGVEPAPSATPLQIADATASRFPIAARPFRSLAEAVTAATYQRGGASEYDTVGSYGTSTLRQCGTWTHQVERAVNDSIGIPARIRRYFTRW